MLKAGSKLTQYESAVVLIVGSPGVGKHQFAKSLLSLAAKFSMEVRVATSLPLPENSERPQVDFVVLMIDLTNRESYSNVRKSLTFLDVSYFVGKVCLVVTQVCNVMHVSVSSVAVKELAQSYRSPLITCDLTNESDRVFVASRVMKKLEVSLGLCGDMSNFLTICSSNQKQTQSSSPTAAQIT